MTDRWKRRKSGSPEQRGQPFPVGQSHSSIDRAQASMREEFLSELVKERRYYTLDDVGAKLTVEKMNTQSRMNVLDRELQKRAGQMNISEVKMKVVDEVLRILGDMRDHGRFRVGAGELRAIVAGVLRKEGVDSRVLNTKFME